MGNVGCRKSGPVEAKEKAVAKHKARVGARFAKEHGCALCGDLQPNSPATLKAAEASNKAMEKAEKLLLWGQHEKAAKAKALKVHAAAMAARDEKVGKRRDALHREQSVKSSTAEKQSKAQSPEAVGKRDALAIFGTHARGASRHTQHDKQKHNSGHHAGYDKW